MHASRQGWLASASDVRHDAAQHDFDLGIKIVIPLVHAQMLWTAWSSRGADDDGVEYLANKPLVVHVGSGDAHRQRDAATIGQDVSLYAFFRAIRGIGPRAVPPFGAFTMALSRAVHFQSMPRLPS
jgi:hypothetical protein